MNLTAVPRAAKAVAMIILAFLSTSGILIVCALRPSTPPDGYTRVEVDGRALEFPTHCADGRVTVVSYRKATRQLGVTCREDRFRGLPAPKPGDPPPLVIIEADQPEITG